MSEADREVLIVYLAEVEERVLAREVVIADRAVLDFERVVGDGGGDVGGDGGGEEGGLNLGDLHEGGAREGEGDVREEVGGETRDQGEGWH